MKIMKIIKKTIYILLAIAIFIIASIYGAEKYRQNTIYNDCKTTNLSILNSKCFMNISPFTNQSKYDIFYNALKELNKKEDLFIGGNKEQEIEFLFNYGLVQSNCHNDEFNCHVKHEQNILFRNSLIKCLKTGNQDCFLTFIFNEKQLFFSKSEETAKIIKEANYCSVPASTFKGWNKEIELLCTNY